MLLSSYLPLLLLLAVCADGVSAGYYLMNCMKYFSNSTTTVNDIDESVVVIIFAILIAIFSAIGVFFLVMIIKLKREQR